MELFYNIVLLIAVVLLILCLTYIGIVISSKKNVGESVSDFPPTKSSCPDNWEAKTVDTNGVEKVYCVVPNEDQKNVGNLLDVYNNGTNASNTYGYNSEIASPEKVIDFENPLWAAQGKTPDCQKKAWADSNDVLWDGITNYNKCDN